MKACMKATFILLISASFSNTFCKAYISGGFPQFYSKMERSSKIYPEESSKGSHLFSFIFAILFWLLTENVAVGILLSYKYLKYQIKAALMAFVFYILIFFRKYFIYSEMFSLFHSRIFSTMLQIFTHLTFQFPKQLYEKGTLIPFYLF